MAETLVKSASVGGVGGKGWGSGSEAIVVAVGLGRRGAGLREERASPSAISGLSSMSSSRMDAMLLCDDVRLPWLEKEDRGVT